ncbi:probable disease resistance RPP8-like protein 2 isoform X2 [Ipomoea triloba]|uniref:probable disease resistance RPP8-like protein 2 isoform X2 n=1 Tax=Ipomoea triloba TaxID=35885 RepID=UPI00125CF44B|nr:probable disease resistance RPP8-like protein 2 isoform X2 [Ipomoea triloba]
MMDANTERDLVSFVTEESKERPFSVVCGKEGLGKTTLVQKVYNKPEVRHKFTGCAWITVTHHLQRKTLCKDILSQIDYRPTKVDDDDDDDEALVGQLKLALHSNKYLIVLDGICSMEALLNAMPADKKMPSKVVITTRNKEDTKKFIVQERVRFLEMSPLTEDQSWQLFLKTQLHCHPWSSDDFESTLKEICKKCEGVPLALKLLGNLMAWKERIEWNELRQQECCVSAQQLLELSYSLLPEHLKKCLHYLALFPEETVDIEADKLCNLWIADEDINKMMINTPSQPQDGMLSTAETYLQKLATLGFVQVQEPTKIKSCSLPHYVRDYLCSGKSKEESFFETHQLQVRGLAFYFDKRVGEYAFLLKPKETDKEVRLSILFLNTRQQDDHLLSPKSLDLTNCKLLRALDFNWLDFGDKFPQDINKLAHLRYLSFRDCYLKKLPASIGKNLETLDLRVNPKVVYEIMSISNVLRQLKRLRSLYLPYKFADETGQTKLQLGHLSELENLQNFVSTHCQANDLRSLEKLRYLAATIDGVEDLEVTIECLQREGTSKSSSIHLENIDFYSGGRSRGAPALSSLLGCVSLNALHVHGQIRTLPWPISDKLTEIFLIASELEEDPMPLLGDLRKLQKLGLGNNAFLGDQIICRKSGFPELRYLKLSILPELKTWTLQEGAMLKLSTLIIENCKSLQTLPDGLSTLQELSFVNMPETFTDKYERQGEDFSKIKHVLSIKIINPKS